MSKERLPTFYPIIDTSTAVSLGATPEDTACALIEAGVQIVQFRHKGFYDYEIFESARKTGEMIQQSGAMYIVNDRSDIALFLGADGVHVGQEDISPDSVRTVAATLPIQRSILIGVSVHNEEQLRQADLTTADYLAIGPIFPTTSKQDLDPIVGLEELRRLRAFTAKPIVAIGGITCENAAEVVAAGANSVAVISDFMGSDIDNRLHEWSTVVAFGVMDDR